MYDSELLTVNGGVTITKTCKGKSMYTKDTHSTKITGTGTTNKKAQESFSASLAMHKRTYWDYNHSL